MQNMFFNAKNQAEEEKKKLANKIINFDSNDNNIKIKVTGNGKLNDLTISPALLKQEPEMIEDLLVVNINKALQKADEIRKIEMEKIKDEMMPDFGDIMNSLGDIE